MPQLAVHGPFDESNLDDDLRANPVRAEPRQSFCPSERRLPQFDRVATLPEIEQQLRVEASADLAREDEVVSIEVADEQCAEPDAGALRIGESSHDKLL